MGPHSIVSPQAWDAIEAGSTKAGTSPGLVASVLEARLRLGGEANRRRLFAALDMLLGEDSVPATAAPVAGATDSRGPVLLRSITARNWAVYRRLALELPAHDPDRPIVLIGGRNGSGKTSLLSAIVFALFGRLAIRDIFTQDRTLAQRFAYRQTIEAVFHRPARDGGETVMSLTLRFDTTDGPLEVERRWYFGDDGKFVEDDEEIMLRIGDDMDLLSVPPDTVPSTYYQEEIARRLFPPGLAPFLFFDGEQVDRLGGRHLTDQLRAGVDGLIGAPYLRQVIADLRDYARDRGREANPVRGESSDAVEAETAALERRESEVGGVLTAVESAVTQLRARRDLIIAELGRLTGDTFANLQDLLEQQRRTEAEEARARVALAGFAAEELPLHLVGRHLRARLSLRLGEEERARTTSAADSDSGLERFLDAFAAEVPALTAEVHDLVVARVRSAWSRWLTPDPLAGEMRHHYLEGRPRTALRLRLDEADRRVRERASQVLEELARCERARADLSRRIAEQRGSSERRELLQIELQSVSEALEAEERVRRDVDRELEHLRRVLGPKREAIRDQRERLASALPSLGRADRATELATGLERALQLAADEYTQHLSATVTRTYRQLAHKNLIHQIEVLHDGGLRVADRGGRRIENLDASAGERHVFAISLLAAVAEVGGMSLPVIMDTPLGRLDREHRENILAYCAARRGQTLLLSHAEEVGGRYLEQIDARIAARFLIEHEPGIDGPGESRLIEGYFARAGAS